jgi:pSer/pThr/pTyr-binding forkhead associated (FHA) protein
MRALRANTAREWLLRNPTGDELFLRLEPGETSTVGRDLSSDLTILDAGVSRHHATFTLEADGLWLEDLHSQNGTFVNMETVHRVKVHSGDVVTIGRVSLTLIARDAPEYERDPLRDLPRERMEALLRVLHDLMVQRGRDKVLRKLIAAATESLGADRGAVFLWEKGRRSFQLAAASPQDLVQATHLLSPTFAESVLRQGKAHLFRVEPPDRPPVPTDRGTVQAGAPRFAIVAPLRVGASPLGLLYVDAPIESRSFVPEDAEHLLALAWAASPLVEASSDLTDARESNRRLESLVAEKTRELGERGAAPSRGRAGDRTPSLLRGVESRLLASARILDGIDDEASDALEEATVVLSGIRRLEDRRSSRFEEMQVAHALSVALAEGFRIEAGGDLCVAGAPDDLFAALRIAKRLLAAGPTRPGERRLLRAWATTEGPAWVTLRLEPAQAAAPRPRSMDDLAHLLRRLTVEHLQGAIELAEDGSSLKFRLPHAARALQETVVVDGPVVPPGSAH